LGVAAGVHLGGTHRVTADDAADDHRVGTGARTGQRGVDPGVAGFFFEDLGEFGDSRSFTGRSPPVRDFELGSVNGGGAEQSGCQTGNHCKLLHGIVLPTITWSETLRGAASRKATFFRGVPSWLRVIDCISGAPKVLQ